ncbi:MAG: AraC family transcriptional regulator [Xanthomonadales bacterium]|nr:AraC family transcriptional regulator [Xanthomonadales bacterium]
MSERLNEANDFDVLGDVLETLRFRGSIFFRSELAAPWGMSLEEETFPRFHIAMSGDCFVGASDENGVRVRQCEVVMLPGGNSHWIADKPGRELVPSERAGKACELGNPLFQHGEITNRLICGLVRFEQTSSHPILDSLPEILHFQGLSPTTPIWQTVNLIDAEMQRTKGRGNSIIDRLTEVLFIQLLNHHINESKAPVGFLAALGDRRIHRALTLIHAQPEYDWSLSSLGERVGMSRATLVRHFQDAVGVAPMKYIMNWRILKAYSLIKYTSTPMEQIADSVGFASARTLGRAFQRLYDCTPSELRRG